EIMALRRAVDALLDRAGELELASRGQERGPDGVALVLFLGRVGAGADGVIGPAPATKQLLQPRHLPVSSICAHCFAMRRRDQPPDRPMRSGPLRSVRSAAPAVGR